MKHTGLIILMAASLGAQAQTAAKPATGAAKPATSAAKPGTTATHTAATGIKLPPGVPAVRGLQKTLFSLRYQDVKMGTGAEAEPYKLFKVHYTGWLASTGSKFDSSYDHPRQPLKDKDGKPELDADGKPKMGDAEPIQFPDGFGRVIPGWDQGFYGMKVGGKRRLFIPWQLAYGEKGRPGPDAAHPGIPAKSDLIFDVELIDITDMPAQSARPGMMSPGARPAPGAMPPHGSQPMHPAAPGSPATPGAPATPPAANAPASPAPQATPATPPATTAPPAPPASAPPPAPTQPTTPPQAK